MHKINVVHSAYQVHWVNECVQESRNMNVVGTYCTCTVGRHQPYFNQKSNQVYISPNKKRQTFPSLIKNISKLKIGKNNFQILRL